MLTLDKCEEMGADAALGLDVSPCPFAEGTEEWLAWFAGYEESINLALSFYLPHDPVLVYLPRGQTIH